MLPSLSRTAIAAAALCCAGAANALVLTFDNLPPSPFAPSMPLIGHTDEFYESGFFVAGLSFDANAQPGDLVGAIVDGSDVANTCFNVACPTNNPSSFYASLNDGYLAIGALAPLPFTVDSLSASFLGASGAVQPPVSGLLRLQGVRADGGADVIETLQLPGPDNAGQYAFSNYTLNPTFASTQLTQLFVFGFACDAGGNCQAFSTNRGQFALDNLSVTPVPEPSRLALAAIGLALVGGVVRRRAAR